MTDAQMNFVPVPDNCLNLFLYNKRARYPGIVNSLERRSRSVVNFFFF